VLLDISIAGKKQRLELRRLENGWECSLNGREVAVDAEEIDPETLSLLIDGHSFDVRLEPDNKIFIRGKRYAIAVDDPRSWRGRRRAGAGTEGPKNLIASMPGKIVRVLASEGEKIRAGQGIAVIEAMKMQNEIKSPKEGTLKKLLAQPGMNVNAGEVLAIVE
jgi:biotin carboxyl carrier protein